MNASGYYARFCFTGSRVFSDASLVWSLCFGIARALTGRQLLFTQGGATGADELVRAWHTAVQPAHVELVSYPADWKEHGPAAGPIRNRIMLDSADPHIVFAFDGNRGTRDCVSYALRKKIKVISVPSLQEITKPDILI